MAPRAKSRYRFTSGLQDAAGRRVLSERVPFTYVDLADNKDVQARDGDTWFSLAAEHYRTRDNPNLLYWVICDFQPDGPVLDPGVPPAPGSNVVVPSLKTFDTLIDNESRRREH